MAGTDIATETLAARITQGERRAIAAGLSLVERQGRQADAARLALLRAIAPHLGRAVVAGITGPPGAGKSTLVNGLVAAVRAQGRRVAVLAVDPSSPVTGGAILGDRIRMTAALDDDGVLVRSLGSQGGLGGVTPAAVRMIDVLDAAGFDLIIIETVGIGQSEVDITQIADVVAVISAPGLGDGVQAMKAGLLEVGDILVVNKADRPGAERTAEELAAARSLSSGAARGRDDIPVLRTSALSGEGIDVLRSTLERLGRKRLQDDVVERRRRRARYLIARAAAALVEARILAGGDRRNDRLADRVLAGEITPDAAASEAISGSGDDCA